MKVLTAAQMQELDRRTIAEVGIPGVVLMENAGRGAAELIRQRFAGACSGPVLVLAGKGNNGGDGFVIARYLQEWGWPVKTLVLAERDAIKGDAALCRGALEACGGTMLYAPDQASLEAALATLPACGLLVDALLGTGLSQAPSGHYVFAIDWVNRQPVPVVAVDIPSGVDASSGGVPGTAVQAELTVTFAFPKLGLVSYPGAALVGELITIDIGIPAVVQRPNPATALLIDAGEARALLPARPADGHKGTFGHLLVLAGSVGKGGAAVMTAQAGLRGGAGLVTLACPLALQPVVAGQLVEVMTAPLPDVDGQVSLQALDELMVMAAGKQALAVGPGLGLGAEVGALVRRLLQDCDQPAVVDADGLNALEGHLDILARRAGRATILTPHPGEMARLTGLSTAAIQADRIRVATDFADRYQVVLVLKGARTLVASPDGRILVNASGHAGMASGGMGDVLTGLIGSLLAQGVAAADAAALGCYLHGLAADRLLDRFGVAGLLATDLLHELPAARQALTRSQ